MIQGMLAEAMLAILANKMRSLLTMLGMVIGVAAVILMLALGSGAQYTVNQGIASMGANLLLVISGAPATAGVRGPGGGSPTITLEDNQAISELSTVLSSAPTAAGSAQIVFGSNNWSTTIYGTTPSYLDIREWGVSSGAMFTEMDVRAATRVVVIGATVVKKVFEDTSPVGQTLRIAGNPYTVVGVLSPKGQSLDGRDQDDVLLVPVTTANRKLIGGPFPEKVRGLIVKAASAKDLPAAEEDIKELLRQRHRIGEAKEDDFDVKNLTALVATAQVATKALSALLGGIASISLIVGGIGIMNIMLVSVTERTREIGIRAAIGARKRDILMQFLAESVFLSVTGCLLGVLVGVGGAWLISQFVSMPIVVTGVSVLASFGVAAGIGVFFGYYPAKKASRLKPIDALRQQ